MPEPTPRASSSPSTPTATTRRVIADKAYAHPSTRRARRARGITFTCPERSDQIARRKAKGPPAADHPPSIGASLARLEGRIVLDEILDRFPDWKVHDTRATFDSAVVRCWGTLPTTVR